MWPFKRKKDGQGGDAIAAFWDWWAGANERIAAEIESGRAVDLAGEISEHVHTIDENLAWELGPGVSSKHHLCVSTEGDGALRVVTERWASQAPPACEVWEYYPARQPLPNLEDSQVVFDDVEVAFSDYSVATEVDNDRERIHVGLWHPAMTQLPDDTSMFACFLALDNALGEDAVETWIGGVDRLEEAPADGLSLVQLRDSVAELERNATGEQWVVLKAEREDGYPLFVTTNLALKRADHLLFDNHYEVIVALKQPREDGLTTDEEAEELNAGENELLDALGRDAVYIGRETVNGRRVIHFHAAASGPAGERIEAWARRQSHDVEVRAHVDPNWEVLMRWG